MKESDKPSDFELFEEGISSIRESESELTCSRRKIITGFSTVVAAMFVSPLCDMAEASQKIRELAAENGESQRDLLFYCPNTKESLAVTYWENGKYIRSALRKVNHHFRDHYCGRVHVIDPHLLDYLYNIKKSLGLRNQPFHILSAYRTPKTNAMLRRHSKKVAKHSYHVYGKAVDIRVPGISTSKLRRAAYRLKMGGVGYYKREHFVHADTGQFRAWWG